MSSNDERVDTPTASGTHDHDLQDREVKKDPESPLDVSEPEPHSIYTSTEKWAIVALIGFGGLFSPLSSNIYFPVIPTLSEVFHKSIELINLTVTMYIVFQGLAPMFWGTLADSYGRRLMFICCLLLLSVSCVGLALVPTNAYWLLLFLRCFQSAGSARVVFFGVYNIGPLVGPAVGPVLGGALGDHLGWRSIFWFLCIASAACALTLILFLPETLRSLVGNGSIPPPTISRPVIPLFGRGARARSTGTAPPTRKRKPFQNPLRLLFNPDILILLTFNGLICAVFYGVNTSIATVLHETYPTLSETELGLCYIAIGGGMLLGSVISGKLLDWDYQRVKRGMSLLSFKCGEDPDQTATAEEGDAFPIEKARMRLVPVLVACFVASCVAYGWCIERGVNLAGPLVFLVGVGIFTMAIMNSAQTLILDLVPSQGSSVTACNNLVRCALSAAMVAVIQLILDALGAGWTYVLLAGLCVVASPLIWVVIRIGPGCRAKRKRVQEGSGGARV
ncbi:MFS domain-containing protein [Mycena sanguinolenta]|uniref:MFS domain-containing protein n=1 Tax=Mycena sanguinolenta TaxID=230812 RepID=A0A8H7CFS2_9AGAR|nr:MFS domain-containing protein [Mycena sanguinolenta]KAF7376745.1 MFS domain-containing protein [Mycena sanguinolenta]